jgi:hypothetical protein
MTAVHVLGITVALTGVVLLVLVRVSVPPRMHRRA